MAGAPHQQQNPDNSLAMLWGILFVFALAGIIWFVLHDYIASCILGIRWVEARLIGALFPPAQHWVGKLEVLSPDQLSFSDIVAMSTIIGSYLRFPASLLLIAFAWLVYLSRANLQFNRYYSMQSLVGLEKSHWPQITPVVSLDLVNTEINKGPWAMALTPFQFAEANHLLELRAVVPEKRVAAAVLGAPYKEVSLKKEAARHIFSMQLGVEWREVADLSMPMKALFAIFAARGVRDRTASDQLLNQISKSAAQCTVVADKQALAYLDFSGTEALLSRHQHHPLVTQVTQGHAYVLGVMASMLELARQDGVLASAEFLWLKLCDRRLWFMLNCIGRQTAYAEVAGPFAHWVAERTAGSKLRVPMVDVAVDALALALREVRLPDGIQG